MALCASTPISEVIVKGCCCCCRCPCHETKPSIPSIRATGCASATSEAELAIKPSARRHGDLSEWSNSTNTSHARSSMPSSRGPVLNVCSGCAFKDSGRGACQQRTCRCSLCCSCSCSAPTATILTSLLKSHPFLSCLPIVDKRTDEEKLADAITKSGYPGSFAWSKESSPCGYARLCRAGFLPIAERFVHSDGEPSSQLSTTLLLPKLHLERMCLLLKMDKGVTLASKNLRRKSRHFLLSVDRAFDEVLAGCVRRHGENWLWKAVRQLWQLYSRSGKREDGECLVCHRGGWSLQGYALACYVRSEPPKCVRALHRRTLRDGALRRQREDSLQGSATEARTPSHHDEQTVQQSGSGCVCPEDVQLHSFEVWVPLSEIASIKLLPVKASTAEEADTSTENVCGGEATTTALSEALTSLGSSTRIGEASTEYSDLCLVAGEVGVSVGRVYTSLTAFTDADSAGTAQLTATRLLLRKAGYELLDLGMNLPYKASLGAKPLPRDVFLKLFRRLRDRYAAPLDVTMQHCHELAQAVTKPQCGDPGKSKGKLTQGRSEASRTSSKERIEEPAPSAAEKDNRADLPPGFVRCTDLFRLLDGS